MTKLLVFTSSFFAILVVNAAAIVTGEPLEIVCANVLNIAVAVMIANARKEVSEYE
jgi:hypothetical protein